MNQARAEGALVVRFMLAVMVGGALLIALPQMASAAFSGKNGRIAFVRDGDIWTVSPTGARERRVTRNPAREDDPSWSPNGRWIAFTRYLPRAGPTIFRVRPNGTRLRRITAGAEPTWAPNGRRIAFRDHERDAIWIVKVNGGGLRSLTGAIDLPCDEEGADDQLECIVTHPAWGPFGSRIAFSWGFAIDSGVTLASVKAADASDYRDLGLGWMQDFSPNGFWLAFHDHEFAPTPDVSWIGLVTWQGEDRHAVIERFGEPPYNCCAEAMTAAWAPNGKRLVVGSPDEGVRTLNPDGSNVRYLTQGDNPSWQPKPSR